MNSSPLPYRLREANTKRIGLIVLQADETIELEVRRMMPQEAEILVTRVPSGTEVTTETLPEMEAHLATAASLFPVGSNFAAVGYACTSGTAEIGAARVARRVREGTSTEAVTDPVTALATACRALGLARLALLSPYVGPVSDRLRQTLRQAGIETPAFASFEVAEEALVARIDGNSITDAVAAMSDCADIDGVFLSCTNLRTLDVIAELESRLDLPVLSSNLVLAWHLIQLAGVAPAATAPGRLFAAASCPH